MMGEREKRWGKMFEIRTQIIWGSGLFKGEKQWEDHKDPMGTQKKIEKGRTPGRNWVWGGETQLLNLMGEKILHRKISKKQERKPPITEEKQP